MQGQAVRDQLCHTTQGASGRWGDRGWRGQGRARGLPDPLAPISALPSLTPMRHLSPPLSTPLAPYQPFPPYPPCPHLSPPLPAPLAPHRSQTNAQNAANIAKVQQVAVAGIVLAVLLALVALIVGTVYVSKTKAIDSKYSRIITDWIPGRHDTGMGGVGGPARGGFVNQGF